MNYLVLIFTDARPKYEIIASSSNTASKRAPSSPGPRQQPGRQTSQPAHTPPVYFNPNGNGQFDDAAGHSLAPPVQRPHGPSTSPRPAQTSRTPSRSRRPGASPSPASGSPISPTDRHGPSYFPSSHTGISSHGSPPGVSRALSSTSPRAPTRRLSTTSSTSPSDRHPPVHSVNRNGSPAVAMSQAPVERQSTLTVIASSDGTRRRQSLDRVPFRSPDPPQAPPVPSVSPSRPLPKPMPKLKDERMPSPVVRPPELYPPSQRQSAAIDTRSPSSYAPKQLRTIPSSRQVPRRHPGRASLASALAEPKVAAALLPHLSINSFLALNASSDEVRKDFGGEMVGRWVLKEWGVSIGKERGRSWPGLGVWEGFCKSLLR